ncbi:uncharacterized protein I206_106340 [Kwoniella pini CBS 10737]|uniref:Uncharacterized protein n=1 Tax=Kwoniella pini CBS 10737 TaxID=1296096 RepID=A0A1B9HU09_9TREE|nr:uncharacterized protein I206_07142 [Kwoniella pini CBS 10737]OCF46755.1 hypothetical protein I206_07142 [Kwoniella pini CBS 10737]
MTGDTILTARRRLSSTSSTFSKLKNASLSFTSILTNFKRKFIKSTIDSKLSSQTQHSQSLQREEEFSINHSRFGSDIEFPVEEEREMIFHNKSPFSNTSIEDESSTSTLRSLQRNSVK